MIDFSKKPLFLAPLAGFSDAPFRSVVKKFGCDVTISEMISANALVFKNEKTLKMLSHQNTEKPFIVQIEGSDINVIKNAVFVLNDIDQIDGIDLNCGCPAKKVIAQNSGSALLKNLPLLQAILSTIKKYSNKTYTSAKIRLGFDEKIHCKIAKICEECGANFITIHGRTKMQEFSSKVDFDAICEAKNSVKIPVIANGDIDENNALEILQKTRCDGLMIGRKSITKPWIFYQIKHQKSIDAHTKKQLILYHFDAMLRHYGEFAVRLFRKNLHEYSKNSQNASAFRNAVNSCENANDMRNLIVEFF